MKKSRREMTSPLVANHVTNMTDRPRDSRRRKKKAQAQTQVQQNGEPHTKWKSEARQQLYSSKLIQALSEVRIGDDGAPPQGRAVRDAADRALAFAAKGRTRWSRAILKNRIKIRFRKQKRHMSGSGRTKKPAVNMMSLSGKSLPAVERKAKVLGRLVPGCRKEALPVILEEATDYIAALEMQVRTMSALARLLSDAGPSSSSSSEPSQTRE